MITNTIGIDIGTSQTVISERGGGILLCEPTIAVINPYTSGTHRRRLGSDRYVRKHLL